MSRRSSKVRFLAACKLWARTGRSTLGGERPTIKVEQNLLVGRKAEEDECQRAGEPQDRLLPSSEFLLESHCSPLLLKGAVSAFALLSRCRYRNAGTA